MLIPAKWWLVDIANDEFFKLVNQSTMVLLYNGFRQSTINNADLFAG